MFRNAEEMELTDDTNEHEAGGGSFAKRSRKAVYSLVYEVLHTRRKVRDLWR
jgi:hypothetical protein